MPFPQGGDFVRNVNRDFNIVASDPKKDQGEGKVLSSPNPVSAFIAALFPNEVDRAHPMFQLLETVARAHELYAFDITKEGAAFIAKLAGQVQSAWTYVSASSTVSSFWRMAQFNPGVLPRLPGVYSDLFVYDVIGSFTFYNRVVVHMLEVLAARFRITGTFDFVKNIVSTDYYTTISGGEDICVGDEEPPFITYVEPAASGTHVRPQNQIVEFLLADAVGGVDISTVDIDLTSQTTSGTIPLVTGGTDQTGGNVAIIGDPSSYRFRYTPPFLWARNDIVTVSISGSDTVPLVDGNPFFCGASSVNTFIGDLWFQVANEDDLGATLNVIGDVSPPYISQAIPASGTSDNNVFTNVTIKIADDLTGVDLGNLFVNIDGKQLVNAGVPTTEETVVAGSPAEFTITYSPESAFSYGSTSTVTVTAQDRVETGSPNVLSSIYSFSFVDAGTLIIENFEPAPGTHHNLDSVDIKVDIRDDSYGVDSDQTFFVINDTIVSGTKTPLASGIQMVYHPPNDFAYDEPIRVTVHGTNANTLAPVVKESFFTLFYGNRLLYFNEAPYEHDSSVDVYVRARNIERFYKDLSTGYFFTTYTQPQDNLGASIVAINPQVDLPATLTVVGPEHRYGETVTVEFSVEDLDGHFLGPYVFTYTIENKP